MKDDYLTNVNFAVAFNHSRTCTDTHVQLAYLEIKY